MKTIKRTTYRRKYSPLGLFQHVLGFLLLLLLLFGLVPGVYDDIYIIFAILLIVQIITSVVRIRVFHAIFELVIFALAFVALLPVLGWFVRVLCVLLLILDIITLSYYKLEKSVIVTREGISKKKDSNNKKPKDVKDAKFKEK